MSVDHWEHPVAERLRDFASGLLPEEDIARVAAHLDGCATCRAFVDESLSGERFLSKLRSAEPFDGGVLEDEAERQHAAYALHREVQSNLSWGPDFAGPERPIPPEVGEYTVLREVGRGGMGVVYQARHRSLGRLVALKMILAGEFASESQRQRFRREAELAARVQHPNIVQIYEVGVLDGRPFLALEYVEGGTLDDRQRQRPLSFHVSAALVETLARAVHHAHLKGVIHRDLKPANILLQESAGPLSGGEGGVPGSPNGTYLIPKIADFGLARSSERADGLTQTGMVMGTPSYISPEQARGERQLGRGADIYALGAILYDLLAGRPPFLAETPIQTVHQVLDQEPARPSTWLASVPTDLETICLKCLQKDPAKRYGTAEDLANDLRAWQQGERIVARPMSSWERAAKWCRRRPAFAALLFAVGALAAAVTVISTVAAIRLRQERNAVVAESEHARRSEQQRRITLVDSLLNAAPASVPYMLETLTPSADLAVPLLRQRFEEAPDESNTRLRAAVGLTVLGEPRTEFLLDSVPNAHAAESGNLALALRRSRGPGIAEDLLNRARKGADARARARYAILLLDLADPRGVRPLLAFSPDPNLRSVLIDEFQSWHGDLAALPALLRDCDDADCRAGLVTAVGRVDPAMLSSETRLALTDVFCELYMKAPDAGTHSASAWALRQWGQPLPALERSEHPSPESQWFVNRSGVTMVGLRSGGFVLQAPTAVLLTRPFFMSDREVSLALFRQFIDDPNYAVEEKPAQWAGPVQDVCREVECPVNNILRPEPLLFCNWLSDREGRRRCYRFAEPDKRWVCDFEADGYRLPTEGEWDYAHRAGATTTFFFGDDPRWLASYAHTSSLWTAPGGSKLPNRWGLFDMVGNVWELCWDAFGALPPTLLVDPTGPPEGRLPWVGRGGAFDSGSFDTRSVYRVPSSTPGPSLGFRVVCREPGGARDEDAARDVAFDHAIGQCPDNGLLRRWRADCRARAARWKEAAADLRRATEVGPVSIQDGCCCASLFVWFDDQPGYRQICARLVERCADTADPWLAELVSRTCLLRPGPNDLERIQKLTDVALNHNGDPSGPFRFGELARTMADYRADRFADVVRRMTGRQTADDTRANQRAFALALLFQAMAHQRLGQHDLALRAFAEGERRLAADLRAFQKGHVPDDWDQVVVTSIVHREALALVKSPSAPGPAILNGTTAR